MFATEDDYAQAVKGSSIHMHGERVRREFKVRGLISLSILAVISYYGYNHYSLNASTENNFFVKNIFNQPTAVMGVTHTSDDEYLNALNSMEVDILTNKAVDKKVDTNVRENLIDEMSLIVNDTILADNSKYTKQLTKEITGKESDRVIVVKKGDTLASLSVKYYGNAMQYNKIIANNAGLTSDSSIIYAGQKIKLPY